jgi:hypothetical protein
MCNHSSCVSLCFALHPGGQALIVCHVMLGHWPGNSCRTLSAVPRVFFGHGPCWLLRPASSHTAAMPANRDPPSPTLQQRGQNPHPSPPLAAAPTTQRAGGPACRRTASSEQASLTSPARPCLDRPVCLAARAASATPTTSSILPPGPAVPVCWSCTSCSCRGARCWPPACHRTKASGCTPTRTGGRRRSSQCWCWGSRCRPTGGRVAGLTWYG